MTAQEQLGLGGLLARVKTATGADRELDAAIASLLLGKEVKREPNRRTWRMGHKKTQTRDAEPWVSLPAYTASIDATLALTERMLPGWTWMLESGAEQSFVLWQPKAIRATVNEFADTLPLAILAALLTALLNTKENGE